MNRAVCPPGAEFDIGSGILGRRNFDDDRNFGTSERRNFGTPELRNVEAAKNLGAKNYAAAVQNAPQNPRTDIAENQESHDMMDDESSFAADEMEDVIAVVLPDVQTTPSIAIAALGVPPTNVLPINPPLTNIISPSANIISPSISNNPLTTPLTPPPTLERNFVGETQQKLLSSILPRPKFSGNPFDWVDFAREFQFYWKFNNFGPEIYSVILLSCLPADDQVLYRGHLAKGMSKDVFVRRLNDRFAIREKYTTRERWYGTKLAVSKSVLGFEKFVLLWETLRDELPGVSEDESKQAFLTALPTPLRSLTLKREAKAEKLFSTSECVQFLRKHLSAESRASDLKADLNSSANISVQAV